MHDTPPAFPATEPAGVEPSTLAATLKRALLAGLAAAVVASIFHLVLTEPVIDRAIELEGALVHAEGRDPQPVVSREAQRVGLASGFLIYGLSSALLFGAAFHLVQRWLPGSSPARRGLLLAAAAYWATALFPFVKYPANPPGVGDAETIAYRQGLYLGFLALSLASVAGAVLIGTYLERSSRMGLGLPVAVVLLAMSAGAAFAFMPSNPDPVLLPEAIVSTFRGLALGGLTLFWVVLGSTFVTLGRTVRQAPRAPLVSRLPRGPAAS